MVGPYFPSARAQTQEGIIAIGGDFSVDILLEAYTKGIFPWPQAELSEILWFSPEQRGVLDFSELHIAQSLQKFAKRHQHLKFTVGGAFQEVMLACQQQQRPGQQGTWILPEMIAAYTELFNQGHAISVECWEQGRLVGGIYGVLVAGLFSGESMFFRRPNASKLCFWRLVEYLRSQGHRWMDIQMLTPVTTAFGGKLISREEFLKRKNIL